MNSIVRTTKQGQRNPFDALMNDFFEGEFNPVSKHRVHAKPSANVYETNEDYRVELLVPGFEKSDLNISINDKTITIKGEKDSEKTDRKQLRREFKIDGFHRSFKLTDDVKVEDIEANYNNGILEVVLKKSEPKKAEAKKIEIK